MADTLATSTTEVLARMLQRLPPSLWDVDPTSATVQRDLYRAVAQAGAVWLENREIARRATLLLEAEGRDLDTLLADYGLKRFLQRPDAFARQVAEQILFTPKGTLYAVQRLADVLFDLPQVTLRTGRSEQHVLVADTHPITTPYSYWGLVSDEGLWYAVTVDGTVPTISTSPPPGVDQAPGPQTLRWFTVHDEHGADWYVTIRSRSLCLSQTPPAGYGTAAPFHVLDGHSQWWHLEVRASEGALVSVRDSVPPPETPGLPNLMGYWRLQEAGGTVWGLWLAAGIPTLSTNLPPIPDQTPGGVPLDWFTVQGSFHAPWYVSVAQRTLVAQPTLPAGLGTAAAPVFVDTTGQRWTLVVDAGAAALGTALETSPVLLPEVITAPEGLVVLSPAHPFQAVALVDSLGVAWWLSIQTQTGVLSQAMPVGAQDVTPVGGPFRWLRLYDGQGGLWYVSPETWGVLTLALTSPGGLGTAAPQTLGDGHGVRWRLAATTTGSFSASDTPQVTYGGMATAVCLNDATGARWFWRVSHGALEWAPELWPNTMDQSPWGELGWLQTHDPSGNVVSMYPDVTGRPQLGLGAPATSPWGWQEPVILVDTDGVRWELIAAPVEVGYWTLLDDDAQPVTLSMEAQVPTLNAASLTGVDLTPAVALAWLSVWDAAGGLWYVQVRERTLTLSQTLPAGTGTRVPFYVRDTAGQAWHLEVSAGEHALRAVPDTDLQSYVSVAPLTPDTGPLLPGALDLRDAVQALGHVQSAGSLVTVLVS